MLSSTVPALAACGATSSPTVANVIGPIFQTPTQGWLATLTTSGSGPLNAEDCRFTIWHSTSRGQAWSAVTPPKADGNLPCLGDAGQALTGAAFLSARRAWVPVVAGNSANGAPTSTIWQTSDSGQSWARLATIAGGLSYLTMLNQTNGFDYVSVTGNSGHPGQGMRLLSTQDGGRSWKQVAEAGPGLTTAPGLNARCIPNGAAWALPSTGILVGSCLTGGSPPYVYRSNNGGVSWSLSAIPIPTALKGASATSCACTTSLPVMYGSGDGLAQLASSTGPGDFVLITADAGQSWRAVSLPDGYSVVQFVSFRTWLVGNGRTLRWTRDGGQTWSVMRSNVAFPFQTSFVFVNAATGWAVTRANTWRGTTMRVTTDSGRRWAPLPLP